MKGEVQTKEEATVYVKTRIGFIRDSKASRRYTGRSLIRKTLRRSRIFLPLDQCQKPQLIKDGRRIKCNTANFVPIVVPGLSTGSSSSATPTSPTTLSPEAVVPTQHPSSTRSESTGSIERVRWDPSRETEENKKPWKNRVNERVRRDPLRDLPEWLDKSTENLVDESVPEHRDAPASSSRESASEPRGKVVSGKYSIHTHFPKDRNCDICLRHKNNKGSLQKTHCYSRASSGKIRWLDNSRSQCS